MDDVSILRELENLAGELGLEIRYETIESYGGLCRVGDKRCLILNKSSLLSEVVGVLSQALSRFPLEDVFINPHVRELLQERSDQSLLKTS
jgi:hypothetical protein